MKQMIFLLLFSVNTLQAQETTKSTLDDLKLDFAMACELSKLYQNLLKDPELKKWIALIAERHATMMDAALRTQEAKMTFRAVSKAALNERSKLWHQSAKEVGLKNWKCPTIGN